MSVQKRGNDDTVTLVKAIGIILMVLGHVIPSDMVLRKAIFTFHMPLFFIMSGYCFKEKYLEDAKQFVVRKIKGIYVPFVVFSLVFLALHFLAFKLVTFGYIKLRDLPIELLQPLEVPDGLANTGGGILSCVFVGICVPLIFVWLWIKIKAKMIPIIRQNKQK